MELYDSFCHALDISLFRVCARVREHLVATLSSNLNGNKQVYWLEGCLY